VTGWLIVVDRPADLPGSAGRHPVVTTRDYILKPPQGKRGLPKVLNLSRSYGYQTLGYYASLLAEARGQKVVPSVTTILELQRRNAYAYALPDLEETLNRTIRRLSEPPSASFRLFLTLGSVDDPRFARFARQLYDWFRCPMLEVFVQQGEWWRVRKIAPVFVDELGDEGKKQLAAAIESYTREPWRSPKARVQPRFTIGVLFDPKEKLPPSDLASLRHFERIAEPLGLGVELIGKQDLDRIPEFDALWIRETTNIDHHTFRFAVRAAQEGMPVIDDPRSIMRCTNKVYLAELLHANGIPTPRTVILSSVKEIEKVEYQISYPIVLKIPDGSFSRGVAKCADRPELERMLRGMLEDSDLILAQEFMPTDVDWRVGVLDDEPLFVTQYKMARKHWQIVKHTDDGRAVEGGFKTVRLVDAPPAVVETGVRAARLIGKGLYGVDLKKNDHGVFVIEINDNPNLVHDVEDAAERDEVWQRLAHWFLKRLG
jgi:glutathione synthase/RimK-type ligase-like ATP-grasp enzyme